MTLGFNSLFDTKSRAVGSPGKIYEARGDIAATFGGITATNGTSKKGLANQTL